MTNYENIINNLLKNQNDTPNSFQKNLFGIEKYRILLNSVLEILNNNKDADIEELRQKLFDNSGLDKKLIDFFIINKKAPGAVIGFGTDKHQEKIVLGNMQEVIENQNGDIVDLRKEMKEDAIFDLASCTKLFTSVAILQLAGNSELSISDKITKYLPQFNYLGNHTIFDLLTYQPYYTEKRIDSAQSFDEAESILFNAKPYSVYETYGKDRYNDIAPMILKYIVEKVSGLSFEKYVEKNILIPGHMNNTFVKIPENLKENIVNENYNYIVDDSGKLSCKSFATLGTSSDLKAVKLGQREGKLAGHAGLFSTCEDMTNFCTGLINGDILHPELTKEMAKSRTSANIVFSPQGFSYSTHYGFLCNSKNPNALFCDMHQGLSGSSLSQSGWTGTQITIDPVNKINLTFLSNRIHNRIVSSKFKLDKDKNNTSFYLKDGIKIFDSSTYGFDRRMITNACLELAIQEKMLEEIIGIEEKDIKIRKLKP